MQETKLDSNFASSADLAACRATLRDGSRSFYAASFLLPQEVCDAAVALYAFCRVADDAVDLSDERDAAVADLHERLEQIYAGRPRSIPADRAFAGVVRRYGIPRELPQALIEGFEWDAEGRRYEDLSGVYAYSARVAATVGAMMTLLMGGRSAEILSRACDLGVAMQLTNIARDVGEDARNGRIYLPLDWLREAGLDPDAWLADPVFNEAVGAAVQRLLQAADVLYERAGVGIAQLPRSCRAGIHAARFLYAEIGREVERQGLDSVSSRAVVPFTRKASLLTRILMATAVPVRSAEVVPPLAETRFLVDAVTAAPAPAHSPSAYIRPSRRSLDEQVAWVLDLFQRLEERDRERVAYMRSIAVMECTARAASAANRR
ncbi:phytoene/squalene synthase family protein [Thiococcus pfennigii]|jgi:phytoene synthase|uniref:phytoene/squalene synthase family protein n=1 Tax=Thiococcus pfennigii TaxID=1057 RepID=UPI00190602DD|nr:phytoene/squalene synthase family protein [Thiococcus pfennigii]MBK1700643.1 phytoene synthase [Thiococcus pfennigii]MBK1732795.1 phytoene synthase [Thiococcus pfennigii]